MDRPDPPGPVIPIRPRTPVERGIMPVVLRAGPNGPRGYRDRRVDPATLLERARRARRRDPSPPPE